MGKSPRGLASGALGGQYPNPALGLVPAAGPSLYDDFILESDHITTHHGEFWHETTLSIAATFTNTTPTAATETGILTVTTAANNNSGSLISYNDNYACMYRTLPNGFVWCCKITCGSTTAYELWSGFSAVLDRVNSVSNDFIGVRSTGGNLSGVVRNGVTENTVSFGFDCESAYKIIGFEIIDSAVQFFSLDCTDDAIFERTDVGEPQTYIVNEDLYPIGIGLFTTAAATKTASIDFWAMGGRCAR